MPESQLGSGLIKMRSSMVTVRNETVLWMGCCRDVARSDSTVAVFCVSSVIWPLTAGEDRHNMRGLPAMRRLSCEGATTV